MTTYAKVYLVALFFYSIIVETAIYIATHHISLDPFVAANGQMVLAGGCIALFLSGIYGLVERFWN